MRRSFTLPLAALCLSLCAAWPATAQTVVDFTREHGYIEMKDGVRVKYTVLLPKGEGPWPVVFQYEGYNAGSFPDRLFQQYKNELLADGYALFGVSVRGSGCSGGLFHLFSREWAEDGAAAVEWAAAQPWSNGKIGMFSLSYAGIMQLFVAAEQPPHLVSVAPGQVVVDTYRDVGYPGGIANLTFPPLWFTAMRNDWQAAGQRALQDGDAECLENVANNLAGDVAANFIVNGFLHPNDDAWHEERSMRNKLDRIRIPFLGMQSWQDEQTGPRGGFLWEQLDPRKTWTVSANGQHGLYAASPRFLDLLHDWFDYTLKGLDNGFERMPHAQIWHEMDVTTQNPAWVTAMPRWPVVRTPMILNLRADGGLTSAPAQAGEAPQSYTYPSKGPPAGVELVRVQGWANTPVNTAGSLAYTSGALDEDMSFIGEGSADLWLSLAAPSADVQVTITEARPDGQELYVQRGWLRLSQRKLDEARSTPLRPAHLHSVAAMQDMPLLQPALARVEILPFAHTFRKGSAIRLWLDTPSLTGYWDFDIAKAVTPVNVHHDAEHASRLVLGYADIGPAPVPLPACNTLAGQDCREDVVGIPELPSPVPPGAAGSPGTAPGAGETTPNPPAMQPVVNDGSTDTGAQGRFGGALDFLTLLALWTLTATGRGAVRFLGRSGGEKTKLRDFSLRS